ELSPTSFRPLPSKRVPGGTQVILAEGERDSLVVFTQDPLVVKTITTGVASCRLRGAQLARDIAQAELVDVEAIERRLAEVGRAVKATQTLANEARSAVQKSDALVAKNEPTPAYYEARKALQALRDIERAHWVYA